MSQRDSRRLYVQFIDALTLGLTVSVGPDTFEMDFDGTICLVLKNSADVEVLVHASWLDYRVWCQRNYTDLFTEEQIVELCTNLALNKIKND